MWMLEYNVAGNIYRVCHKGATDINVILTTETLQDSFCGGLNVDPDEWSPRIRQHPDPVLLASQTLQIQRLHLSPAFKKIP